MFSYMIELLPKSCQDAKAIVVARIKVRIIRVLWLGTLPKARILNSALLIVVHFKFSKRFEDEFKAASHDFTVLIIFSRIPGSTVPLPS